MQIIVFLSLNENISLELSDKVDFINLTFFGFIQAILT